MGILSSLANPPLSRWCINDQGLPRFFFLFVATLAKWHAPPRFPPPSFLSPGCSAELTLLPGYRRAEAFFNHLSGIAITYNSIPLVCTTPMGLPFPLPSQIASVLIVICTLVVLGLPFPHFGVPDSSHLALDFSQEIVPQPPPFQTGWCNKIFPPAHPKIHIGLPVLCSSLVPSLDFS